MTRLLDAIDRPQDLHRLGDSLERRGSRVLQRVLRTRSDRCPARDDLSSLGERFDGWAD